MLDSLKDDSPTTAERRESLRRRIKKSQLWHREFGERQQALGAANNLVEHVLPDKFEADVSSLQAELSCLADADLDLQLDGKKPDPKTKARQAELRKLIDEASQKFEVEIEAAEKTRKRLARETADFAQDVRLHVVDALKNELVGLVPETQKLRLHVLKKSVLWASARAKDAAKILEDTRQQHQQPDEIFSNMTKQKLAGRFPRLEAEVKYASEQVTESRAAVDELWASFLED
jgi:hypothetical protein